MVEQICLRNFLRDLQWNFKPWTILKPLFWPKRREFIGPKFESHTLLYANFCKNPGICWSEPFMVRSWLVRGSVFHCNRFTERTRTCQSKIYGLSKIMSRKRNWYPNEKRCLSKRVAEMGSRKHCAPFCNSEWLINDHLSRVTKKVCIGLE
jgi:hypothetical protein